MDYPKCPECSRTSHARNHTLYRTEPAPWWMRLLNRLGGIWPTRIERPCGYVVTCQGPKCRCQYGIGDGGPNDVWRLEAASDPRAQALRDLAAQGLEVPGVPTTRRPRDPADGLAMRTERPVI